MIVNRRLHAASSWRILIHPPPLKAAAPSPCEARAGRGLGRGARSIELSRAFEIPSPRFLYVFSAMVGMARCAVPARVVAGGTNFRATLASEGVAPLHPARTSQRDVATTLNTYAGIGFGGEDSAGGAPFP